MKRIISVLIMLCMLLFSVACNGGDAPAETSDIPDTVVTTEEAKDIVIASDGEPIYKLIRYIDASEAEVSLFVDFKNKLKEKFDISFTIGTDWSAPNMAPPADSPEIIIGLCDREAVTEVAGELNIGRGECAVRVCANNKIVILAPDYRDIQAGFDYFIDNLSLNESKELVYTGGNFYSSVEDAHILSDISELSSYKIVYGKNGDNKKHAESIASSLKKNFNIVLEVVSEAEPASEREIIVGEVSDGRFPYSFKELNGLNYQIVTSDKSILIAAKGDSSLSLAVKNFIAEFVRTGNAVSMNLLANNTISFNTFESTNDTALADGADTRIMSFNILSEEWDSAAVMEGRDIRVSSVLLNYRPDVAALQEVSNKWYSVLDDYITDVYKFTRKKTPSGSATYTTLVYNTETTELLEEGIQLYSKGNSQRLRSIVWGIFESKSTGERYMVFSTHWDASQGGPSVRAVQAAEMADFVKSMRTKYNNIDIFACGDYNAKENTNEYKIFMENSGFVDGKVAAQKIKKACNTYHTLFSALNTSSFESIDHITFPKDTASKVLFYNTLYHDYIIDASDHCPIFVDIKLSK